MSMSPNQWEMLKRVEKSRRLNQMAFLGSTPVILSSTSSLGIILTYRITIIKRKKQMGLIFSVHRLQGLEKKLNFSLYFG